MRALDALGTSAFVVDASTRARVRLVGADARAYLHRLSTNHVKDLSAGEGRLNILLTDKGRVVDVVLHLDRGDAGVLLVGGAGRGPALTAWLDRYLFSEQVELGDVSGSGSCAEVAGREAPRVVGALVPGAGQLAPWAFQAHDTCIAVRTFDRVDAAGALVPCFVVLDLEGPSVHAALMGFGAEAASAEESEVARIAAGVPGEAGEVVDKHNPLDLGLHDAVHWNKGCYIGQEVIARLDTYQKQRKRLVSLRLEGAALAGVSPGAHIVLAGATVGEITSVAPFAWGERSNALGVAKLVEPSGTVGVRVQDLTVDAIASSPAVAQAPHD